VRSVARFARSLLAVLAVLATLVLVPAAAASANVDAGAEQDFTSRLNSARAAAGLPGLAVASDLVANARMHAEWMGRNNTLAHNSNLAQQITNWQMLGENVGYGGSVASIHDALMNSPGHRANILHTEFNQVGIGTWVAPTGRIWVTQVFRKTASAPAPAPAAAPAPMTAIDAKHAALGGNGGLLGAATTAETRLPDGAFRHFQRGSIYWSPATPASEVHGGIRDTWARLGWERSALGYPTTDELPTPDRVGRFNHFQRGSVYWSPASGAREVRGAIRDTWARLGWERSALGYPTTNELPTPDRVGRFNHFQRGSVYWSPASGAREVRGAIRDTWARLGWERSGLGWPVTNELATPDRRGRYNHFQRGSVYWTPTTGAREVRGAIRDHWARTGWELGPLGYPVSDEYAVPGGRRTDFEHGSIVWDAKRERTAVV
jgi:uncharacterized protein with LGFP repeats